MARPFASRLAPAIASGHGLPSRNLVGLSLGNCTAAGAGDSRSIVGAPKAISPETIEPLFATASAAWGGQESLFGRCTRRVAPASTAAVIAGVLTAGAFTCAAAFFASQTGLLSRARSG